MAHIVRNPVSQIKTEIESATQFHRKTGRGNVLIARNPIPKPHKRQNQTIRKNNTIPQLNFHSSWGLAPEVLHPQPIGLLTNPLKSHRRQRRIPTYIRPPAELNPKGTAQIVS